METLEIIGYKRANLGKSESKRLREEGFVPCVLYGGEEQIHFYVPMIQFRELVYTPRIYFVNLNIEGEEVRCIMQDVQFHPVSEIILHADFLQLFTGKPIRMNVPVKLVGQSPGVVGGGTLVHKRRRLEVKSLPKDMPSEIEVDIAELDFGKAIKVDIVEEVNFEIQDPPQASIAVVEIPRALKAAAAAEEEGEEEELAEGEEGAPAAEGGDAPAPAPEAGGEEKKEE